jgi:hypothetical protein
MRKYDALEGDVRESTSEAGYGANVLSLCTSRIITVSMKPLFQECIAFQDLFHVEAPVTGARRQHRLPATFAHLETCA